MNRYPRSCYMPGQDFCLPATTDPMSQAGSPVTYDWKVAEVAVRSGQVVSFPTDTVYGLGCDAHNVKAILAIYTLKGRSATKALPLLLSGPDQVESVTTRVSPAASALADRFWPGPLTIVLPRSLALPAELSPGDTIAVR